jgi:hypothetical protein
MATLSNHQSSADKELIASPMGLIDAEDFRNQGAATDALFSDNDDDDSNDEYIEEDVDDEPVDDDGDPTGEHDHHQDDNYALGGHVTRSGS